MGVITTRIRNRLIRRNQNALILICGGTGSGKSYSAIKLAQSICPKFDIRRHLVFSAKEFMSLLNSGKLRRGDVILWDEAGVGMPSREWFSILNKCVGYVLQTFRHKNLCLMMTTPDISFVDIQARKLFHYYFETVGIDYKREICILKPLEVQVNPRFGRTYYKYPRAKINNAIKTLTTIKVNKIDEKTSELYEQRKKEFTSMLNRNLGKTISKADDKRAGIAPEIDEIVKAVQTDLTLYTNERANRIVVNQDLVAHDFKLNTIQARLVKSLVERAANK